MTIDPIRWYTCVARGSRLRYDPVYRLPGWPRGRNGNVLVQVPRVIGLLGDRSEFVVVPGRTLRRVA